LTGPKRIGSGVAPSFDSGASSLTFTTPPGAVPGDVLLAVLADSADPAPTLPAGWATLATFATASAAIRVVARDVADREPTSVVFDWASAAGDLQGQMLLYRPSSRGSIVEVTAPASIGAVTSHSAPAVVSLQAHNVELCVWRANGAITYTPPAGVVVIDTYTSSAVAPRTFMLAEVEPVGAAGNLPARVATASSAVAGAAMSIVLRDRAPVRAPSLSRLSPGNVGLLP
jgi:hypothetical protein